MGKTIDEHIAQLKKLKPFHNGSYGASINFALDTIRKYQKVEKILSDWINDDLVGMCDYWMGRIKEVMGDENDKRLGGQHENKDTKQKQ